MDSALLAVDVGNTNVTLGVFGYEGGDATLVHHWRLPTHREQTSDEVLVTLKGLCDLAGFPIERVCVLFAGFSLASGVLVVVALAGPAPRPPLPPAPGP